jgi:predicted CXXCH cytochrome family protein
MNSTSGTTVFLSAALAAAIAIAISMGSGRSAEAAGTDNCACHTRKTEKAAVHFPVKEGECSLCHKPSGQPHPKFKKEAFVSMGKNRAELCYECHERKDAKKQVHPPVAAGDCLDCHDPHQSDSKFLLKEAGGALCFMCHEKSKIERSVPHKPVADGKCLGCHDPHQSDQKHLLKAGGMALCITCHNKAEFTGRYVHAPVAAGDCAAGHAPPGTDRPHLLKGAAPDGMYQSFNKANFTLCFGCHTDTLADSQRTDTETSFRNGIFNLHFVHVNRITKGRSCKVCHEPHAGSQPFLISSRVAGFGSWRIPIRYIKNVDGGTCVAGCHKPKSYDRINPVQNP